MGWASLDATLAETSSVADALIRIATEYAVASLARASGREPPRAADGRPLPLLVLGMGKLGGEELNFSSDVDLVFLFPEAADGGESDDERAETYYIKLAQVLIKLLDKPTADGFVYRVDARLRPFGKSGPLAVSVPAFESYLVSHGRDWVRYADVKARRITGVEPARDVFDEILTPVVYRR
jgi:glutamate-ammonia-ligase adenylyltransferase